MIQSALAPDVCGMRGPAVPCRFMQENLQGGDGQSRKYRINGYTAIEIRQSTFDSEIYREKEVDGLYGL